MSWGQNEKRRWFEDQKLQRSYRDEVVSKIQSLKATYDLNQYGALSLDEAAYPLYLLKSKNFDSAKPTVLITGGVHGYETSGVHGALEFMKTVSPGLLSAFNFLCAPCISPWAYETVNRWNSQAIDPNRSFRSESPCEESRLFLEALGHQAIEFIAHFDLHETTDTDNSVFRPALEQRDGVEIEFSEIPDGFYTVGDSENPQPAFQKAVIDSVRKVTHIAPPDTAGNIIGAPVEQEGVIHYPVKKLFLCAGITNARYTTTTEVYPDSPKVTPQVCIEAQVAAITGGLQFIEQQR